MLVRSVREANQNFSKLISDVEGGETVLITKNGRAVAEVRPCPEDRMADPAWRAAYDRMVAKLAAKPDRGCRLGKITEEDKYGDAPDEADRPGLQRAALRRAGATFHQRPARGACDHFGRQSRRPARASDRRVPELVRRRAPDTLDEAVDQVASYRNVFTIVPTDADLLLSAAAFARRYRLQFWDAVI
jgi:prevent-host-death family protein